jgi:Cu/Ag efflux protein CusF
MTRTTLPVRIVFGWAVMSFLLSGSSAAVAQGTEFPGTVLSVDVAAGKFAVKKEGGGSRFTFVVNEKTRFSGGPTSLKDLKKGDNVVVLYSVAGSQYVAQEVKGVPK